MRRWFLNNSRKLFVVQESIKHFPIPLPACRQAGETSRQTPTNSGELKVVAEGQFLVVQESIKHFPIPLRNWLKVVAECQFLAISCCLWLLLFSVSCFAIEQKAFDGKIDFINKCVDLSLKLKDGGTAEIKGGVAPSGEYNISLNLRHFKLGKTDILTDFHTSGIVKYSADGKIKSLSGKAWTERTLLNRKPFKELALSYEIDQDKLKINYFSWADLTLAGQVVFKPSLGLDLILAFNNADIGSLVKVLGIDDSGLNLSGSASGNLKIKRAAAGLSRPAGHRGESSLSEDASGRAEVIGKFMVSDGSLSEIRFNSARINLDGSWPILRFVNSYINGSDGVVYDLRGQFNLGELLNPNCPDNKVMVYSSGNAMRFQDWVIKRQTDARGQDMVEAERSLKKNQALKMRIKNDSEALAWERTVKF